jgi:hypothetical protein
MVPDQTAGINRSGAQNEPHLRSRGWSEGSVIGVVDQRVSQWCAVTMCCAARENSRFGRQQIPRTLFHRIIL